MDERHHDPAEALASALAADLRGIVGTIKRRLRDQAHLGDLTGAQVSALARLETDGPATVTTLARAEGMRPQSMGANIASLEAAGMVQGTPDPADGRQTIWTLTEAFRDRVAAGRAARQDWLFRAIQTHLSPSEQQHLAQAVALLKRIADS